MALISFRYGFVFLKVPKTAGTSIEADLSRLMAADDIVTPVIPPEDGHVARNHLGPDGTPLFYNHMPASRIRDLIGPERFARMTVFCVERDPLAKCISHYHMLQNSELHNENGARTMSWDAYVEEGRFPTSHHIYSEDGAMLADRVLRYDRLSRDLPALLADLGLPDFSLTARAKSGYRARVLVRPEDVTQAQRARIARAFAPQHCLTGIDWPAPAP